MMFGAAYSIVLVAGLVASVLRRRRLGPAAGPAVAGFALLVVADLAPMVWETWGSGFGGLPAGGGLPGVADLPPGLVVSTLLLTVVNVAGTALLIAAVVRRGRRPAQ
ncbi:hypothetical protein Ade02nite_84390 [Paractinoplanes deccanensis]|uniref:Lycopene cyclase domain-containing protein n=1 Tax=Paractinoplanes deccanensis TaxID=113561 RepID=A0ABQ3YIH4_9ACTN|nr:hypothetical protein [Actinoplanes deccanensis]GID79798.1 hypothetical protein Ade02nite_84390 [Actinoplanes deccanensis]